MPSVWTRTLSAASTLTSAASAFTSLGFCAAKASTRFGFSIARSIANVAPIPLLGTSINHLENLSLLPILLGESIASTSLTAASTSLDLISDLLTADDEASFSLATFVSLVRLEWAQHEAAGRSVTEVARAVAAWAAIQGFTKQWSEDRWLKYVEELNPDDFRPPAEPKKRNQEAKRARQRTISRVSVTDDIIMSGRAGQVVSAEIGEKEPATGTAVEASSPAISPRLSPASSPVPQRSNYETRRNLRRLSKMVLAGYGGAGLLFFGAPLQPLKPASTPSHSVGHKDVRGPAPQRTDTEVKDSEEDILVHVVEGAEAEAMSPPLRNIHLPNVVSEPRHSIMPRATLAPEPSPTAPSSSYSWWNVLLGKHDREIFEGFAFTAADESDRDSLRSPLTPQSSISSPAPSTFLPRRSSWHDTPLTPKREEFRTEKEKQTHTALIGDMNSMPRFWVLTDHGRRQVVLVVRGTMSLNELAADLTCEPEDFEPATATSPPSFIPCNDSHEPQANSGDRLTPQQSRARKDFFVPFPAASSSSSFPNDNTVVFDAEMNMPGSFRAPLSRESSLRYDEKRSIIQGSRPNGQPLQSNGHAAPLLPFPQMGTGESEDDEESSRHQVHGGIHRLARVMGSKGKPVHHSISAALSRNRGYELVLCGHSLGAGVAALLALMWADPLTCRTVPSSGLPSNRRVSVYCFAPPCVTSPSLSRLCKNLITSIVYSFDFVSRLSLGSIRDLNRAAFWLCEGQGEESTVSVLRRALSGKMGFGRAISDTEDEKKWFIALRKTLEANMYFSNLFPPGRVWWALRDAALHPSHQRGAGVSTGIRIFEVQQVEKVFQQVEFKGDMLSAHLPHQYDRMLSELEF